MISNDTTIRKNDNSSNFIPTCLYSQSSQIILMYKHTTTTSQSDESAGGRQISELKENLYARMVEIESQLSWSISNAKAAMEEAIEQLQEEMEESIEEMESEIKQCEDLLK